MKIDKFLFFLLLLLLSCSYLNVQKSNSFDYNCNLFIQYDRHSLFGDCYIYQNINGFYIDMYTFGNLVFRLHEKGQKIKIFIQNHEYDYNLDDKFFSIDYVKFKNVLLSFFQSDSFISENNLEYEIISFMEEGYKKLVFKDKKNDNYIELMARK